MKSANSIPKERKKLLEKLTKQVKIEETNEKATYSDVQGKDFDNPFNTAVPTSTKTGVLQPGKLVSLKLKCSETLNEKMTLFVFNLPTANDTSGLLPGQYVKVQVTPKEKVRGRLPPVQTRYFSPISKPEANYIELVLRFESSGLLSQHFRSLKPGDEVTFEGPCGGFEYTPNYNEKFRQLIFVVSGGAVTPALQILRKIIENPRDNTKVTLFYYCDED